MTHKTHYDIKEKEELINLIYSSCHSLRKFLLKIGCDAIFANFLVFLDDCLIDIESYEIKISDTNVTIYKNKSIIDSEVYKLQVFQTFSLFLASLDILTHLVKENGPDISLLNNTIDNLKKIKENLVVL